MNNINVIFEKIRTNQYLDNDEMFILANFMFSSTITQDKFYTDFNIHSHKISKKGDK